MILFYILVALAILQGVISLIEGIRSARHIRTFRPETSWRPPVVVFCPCKGADPEFRGNVMSILDQNYPSFRAVFIVESREDSAFAVLDALNATVLVAGEATSRGQKVHNLIHGVEHGRSGAEVLVFCDSDARFPRSWLLNLIAPLEQTHVAVSTGYRWYVVDDGSMPAILRSVWNASVVTMLGAHSRNFAWGGSMALRADVFDQLRIREVWEAAVSDDYTVTFAARKAGMRIVFVPACLIPSHGQCTWSELLEFTNRQILITRLYEPGMWRIAFVTQTIFNLAFWSSFALGWTKPLAAVACGTLYGLAAAKGWTRLKALDTALPKGVLSKHRWSYILLAPFTALLYQYNMVRSTLSRDILWRQIRYRLISPHSTVVRRGTGVS